MKKKVLLIVLVFFTTIKIIAQEVCESPEDSVDLNSITKCSIKPSKNSKNKNSRQITVRVSASRKHIKRRASHKKKAVLGLGSISAANTKLGDTKQNTKITEPVSVKSSIEDIKNRLSAKEVRKASKFTEVDKIPLFSACKKAKKGEKMDCFNEEMINHISKHFRYPSKAVRESIEGEVWVRFIIDKNGEVRNIKTLGPDNGEILNEEAKRVVSRLTQFIPAKKKGKRVSVKYGFPIAFSLEK
ncbi:energy transducer TonB [Tenacibaculum sp.]|nr:energy transducer TonB [Tenacibaculum sp.]